jgi:hypothetical protein
MVTRGSRGIWSGWRDIARAALYQPLRHIGLLQAPLFEGGKMDELTFLAVGEAIKAEAGVTHHRIVGPRCEDGYVTFGLAFPQRKIIHEWSGWNLWLEIASNHHRSG